ncbi:MAG TPA: tRNA (guanine(10)-N(2))-dimethyltransferase [Nitrososphaeraceae archaeon]|nr:tRNA (guanine(10)-N(2))-dimethyltransferase [Nitrososphaeraceae archaeon]
MQIGMHVTRVLLDETGKTEEGNTKLLVPFLSLTSRVPPKNPAFFNPSAKLSRDISILVYRAFLQDMTRTQKTFADPLSGVGARALRVAVEVQEIDQVHINDLNPLAIELSKKNAVLNFVERKCNFSVNEACKFLLSSETNRFAVLDLDPFGSPAPYIDCALRSVLDSGLISVTATDTAVLCGKFNDVCFRKYYGRAIRCHYAKEIAIRLLLSQISLTASRFGLIIEPLFAHSYSQYIRIYARVKLSRAKANMVHNKLGFIQHCEKCGNRMVSKEYYRPDACALCGNSFSIAGQLWISRLFDKNLIKKMERSNFNKVGSGLPDNGIVDKSMLSTCFDEHDDIPYYFITDEIAAKLKTSPMSVAKVIERLSRSGYRSSKTSLDKRGFKTDAGINEILTLLG